MSRSDLSDYRLLSGQPFGDYSPEGFRDYVKSLKENYIQRQAESKAAKAPASKSPVPGVNFRYNKKGTAIITMRRKPKWITPAEIAKLHEAHGVPSNVLWTLIRTKGIEVIKDSTVNKRITLEIK